MGLPVAISCFACSSVSLRGSVSCSVILPVLVELLDRRFVGDRDGVHVAPFVAHADLEHRHAVRRLVHRLEVPDDVLVVRHVPGLARDVAEELQRSRHLVGRRQVIDQLGQDARIGRGRLDLRAIVRIELLRGGRLRLGVNARCRGHRSRRQAQSHRQAAAAAAVTGRSSSYPPGNVQPGERNGGK